MNKKAKEIFEKLKYKYEEDCYEHPLRYCKKRKTKNIFEVDEDSFTFYKNEKVVTVWKNSNCVVIPFREIKIIQKQIEELGE